MSTPATSLLRRAAVGAAAVLLGGCLGTRSVPPLGTARMTSDFETYALRRVGLLPAAGPRLGADQAADLQAAFFAEFSAATDFEIVALTEEDLEAIPSMEPHRMGDYRPATILAVARRYRLDALLVPTVTDIQTHPPLRLGLAVDLVSTETGQALWAASIQLDASRAAVQESLRAWTARESGETTDAAWELALISPRRFARFAAFQLASLI